MWDVAFLWLTCDDETGGNQLTVETDEKDFYFSFLSTAQFHV